MSRKRKYEEDFNRASFNVADMAGNLVGSVFRWGKLPPYVCPPSESFEILLSENSVMGAFETNELGLAVLKCAVPNVNLWGLPADESAYPTINGLVSLTVKEGGIPPILLYDQPSHRSIQPTLSWYVDALGKLRQSIDSCTRWLKTPVIFQGSEEQAETIHSLVAKIESGYPAIALHKGSFSINDVVITPTNVTPAVLEALHNSYERIKGMLYEELGVPDYNSSKMAQQTSTEVLLPMLAVALKTVNRLAMRKEWADKVNAAYGTEITVQCLSLGLIKQSIFGSTGYNIDFDDLNKNGIPDELETKKEGDE